MYEESWDCRSRGLAVVLKANIEHLATSGVAVTGHGEDLAAQHSAADGRIEAAQRGWQGLSAVAMSARTEAWRSTTSALLARMSDHAQGLHSTALEFVEMESTNAEIFESLVPAPLQQ
jgi:uncharacterized protein YukE